MPMFSPAISLHYFFFFGLIAVLTGFLPLVLDSYGFSAAAIGVVSLTSNVAVTLGAPFSLHLVERVRNVRSFGLLMGLASAGAFALLHWCDDYRSVVGLVFLSMFFAKAVGSLADALAVRASFEHGLRFERTRIWGSFGFLLVMLGLGPLIDRCGLGVVVPTGVALLCPLGWLCHWMFAGRERALEARPAPERGVPEEGWLLPFASLLFSVACVWGSHAVHGSYFSVYLKELGWSATWIAVSFAIGVIAEILLFIWFARIERHIPLMTIYRWSCLVAAVRWLVLASTTDPLLILLSQALHAFTFGAQYIASAKLVYQLLPDHLRNKGQGWLVTFGSSGGVIIGKLVASSFAISLTSYLELNRFYLWCSVAALVSYLVALKLRGSESKTNEAA